MLRSSSCQTAGSQSMAKRIVRYVAGAPRAVNTYPWSEVSKVIRVTVDADSAGCERTRLSTSSGVVQLGRAVWCDWPMAQTAIALSSGESEFLAIVTGATTSLFVWKLVTEFGHTINDIIVRSDSSAAQGMASRLEVGRRAKHRDVCATVALGEGQSLIRLESVPTAENVADLGTMYLKDVMTKLLGILVVEILTMTGAHA